MFKSTFYMVKSTFHIVNFLLFISVSVKCRLQTSDCRLEVKCRLKTADRGKMPTQLTIQEVDLTT